MTTYTSNMPNSPSASFIPKQGPARRSRQTASRQVHIFTILSYVLFVATLAATLGVYLYTSHLQNQLNKEVGTLDGLIGSFKSGDMDRVREFNVRLKQANDRLTNSVSLTSVFSAIESATAQTVQIDELKVNRNDDQDFTVAAKLSTGSFDSSLFQRSVLESNSIVESVTVDDLTLSPAENGGDVSFVATLVVPLEEVPYTAAPEVTDTPATTTPPVPVATTDASSSVTNI